MPSSSTPNSPAAIKKLEKQLNKEAKRESTEIKEALKAVQTMEKLKAKAQKASNKAEETIEKVTKLETATLKALNKATHQHDAALTDLRAAERDAELKRQEDKRISTDLDAKKAFLAESLHAQAANTEKRATQIRELREEAGLIPKETTSGTATPDSRLSDDSSA
uniref:Uncharacterized protein n=1 Tax=Mycena chlorophos TaxID=658473 RepID=A0ABQ0L4V6_MYCCL|nr:predicted protein [Mycena chlorophos]